MKDFSSSEENQIADLAYVPADTNRLMDQENMYDGNTCDLNVNEVARHLICKSLYHFPKTLRLK